MTAARRLALLVVFASLAWTTFPRLAAHVREAARLQDLTLEERRVGMFGPFYESMRRIDASLPPGAPLALVTNRREDIDAALFFAYYVFPRPTWLDVGLAAYRMREPRTAHAALVNLSQSPEARLMTYPAMRAELMGSEHFAKPLEPPAETDQSFVIPLVSSGDGPPPDVYTTEAVIENRGSAPARVSVTLLPSERSETIVLKPDERRTWTDFVYQTFGVMEVGWLRVRSDQPLGARFWLVNRGSQSAERLEPVRWLRSVHLEVPVDGRMWVLNPHDRELPVRLGDADHRLQPHALIPLEWIGGADLSAEDDWYAFVSWRDSAGRTHLRFPEGR